MINSTNSTSFSESTMKSQSYNIRRDNPSSILTSKDNELIMLNSNESNVVLTTVDHEFGIIHEGAKFYAFVEIHKISEDTYAFQNKEDQMFFCSRPLTDKVTQNQVIANRLVAKEWEFFKLSHALEIKPNELIINFISFLKDYKNNNHINLFWWRGKDFINFGDELNPFIISHLTNKKIKLVDKSLSDLIGIGSILDWFPDRHQPYEVWGAGTLVPTKLLPDHKYNISLLRGPLTKSLLNTNADIPYGDPGILVSNIWSKSPEIKYDWGILVHFSQEKKPWVQKLLQNTPNAILIDVKNENLAQLMSQVSSCKNIASTSLHGLIVADSYCIPNLWLWDNNLHRGGQWKFFDYFAGIGRHNVDNVNPTYINSLSDVTLKISNFEYFKNIDKIQNRIINAFPIK